MFTKFASIARGDHYAYAYDSGRWSGGEVDPSFVMYETYGHGLTAHSPAWPITREYMADYLSSLAVAMLADAELVDELRYKLCRELNGKDIEFAASVKWKESDDSWTKRRYYSLKERKISAKAALEHDKRYHAVEKRNDGTPMAIYLMLAPEYSTGLECFQRAVDIREWVQKQETGWMPCPVEFLGWDKPGIIGDEWEKRQHVQNALRACQNVCRAKWMREAAEQHVESLKRDLERKAAQAAETEAA